MNSKPGARAIEHAAKILAERKDLFVSMTTLEKEEYGKTREEMKKARNELKGLRKKTKRVRDSHCLDKERIEPDEHVITGG